VVHPKNEFVEIKFKKEDVIKEKFFIRNNEYNSILLNSKKISKLKIEEIWKEQKWEWEYKFKNINLKIISKIVPWESWEILYLKAKKIDSQIKKQKSWISIKWALSFLSASLLLSLIIWWAFITFIVFNAKTVDDVRFFQNLWINLNDINNFLLTLSWVVFSITIFILTIFLIIFWFKALLTKKQYKRKKTVSSIMAIFFLVITFITWVLWMKVDATIRNLPNWQEMARWNIQVYDNTLLISPNFSRESALITDFNNIIWPIEIKYDLNFFKKSEERLWFKIDKFIWNINWEIIETVNPELIYNFDEKWNFEVSLTVFQSDRLWNQREKVVTNIPNINISNIVEIKETTLPNWWRTIVLDWSDLSRLWKLEWFIQENPETPAFIWEVFRPSKIYFQEEVIWLRIVDNFWNKKWMDKLFLISWNKSEISWEIVYEVSINNDLEYSFRVDNIKNEFWEGFIEKYIWNIEDKIINEKWQIWDTSSPTVKHIFKNYGPQNISVTLENSSWNRTTISKVIDVPKRINLDSNLIFSINNTNLEKVEFKKETKEYFLYDISVNTTLSINWSRIRSTNSLYTLKDILWDIWNNWNIDKKWKSIELEINKPINYTVVANYEFVHRRNSEDIVKVTEYIYIEWIEKEVNLVLNIKPESEYVPTLVWFDASLSYVKNDPIVKYIYDYWNWITEERDAINRSHLYTEAWIYDIKLTVVTQSWKKYSTSKKLVLKKKPDVAKITTSLSKAPVWQDISFISAESVWNIRSYHWDFWDWWFSTQPNPSYSYSKPWIYDVKLTLYLNNWNVVTDNIKMEITERK